MCSLKFKDNNDNPIILRRFKNFNIKYYYWKNNVWTASTDFNVDYDLNIVWVRVPESSYNNDFCLNISVGAEQVHTTGVRKVQWTNLPNSIVYELNAAPVLTDNAQGFAPRAIKVDGAFYWFEYSQDFGGLYNTGIRCDATVSETEGKIEIVDFDESGNMNAITSNAVNRVKNDLIGNINSNTQSINNLNSKTDVIISDVEVLKAKNYTVKLNDKTVSADSSGLIDLGEIKGDLSLDNVSITKSDDIINDKIVPKGSTIYTDENNNITLLGTSSPNDFYNIPLQTSDWYYICNVSQTCSINVEIIIYNNIYKGVVYVEKTGYTYKATTTSNFISSVLFMYNSGMNGYLIMRGNTGVRTEISFDSSSPIYPMGSIISSIDERKISKINNFLTSETSDYITITESPYNISLEDFSISNYLVDVDNLEFIFNGRLDIPVSLRFSTTKNNTKITVRDTDSDEAEGYTFSSTSDELPAEIVANFVFSDKDNFNWDYSRKDVYEVVSNKVQTVNENSTEQDYPSAKAVYDAISSISPETNLNIKNGEGLNSIEQISDNEPSSTKAFGEGSAAFNLSIGAHGAYSTTFGASTETTEDGRCSIAGGNQSVCSSVNSIAVGSLCFADGPSSAAFGNHTMTRNTGEFACGTFNVSTDGASAEDWTDATIFSVGIGESPSPKNALEIKLNGGIWFNDKDGNYIKLQDSLGGGSVNSVKVNGVTNLPNNDGTVALQNLGQTFYLSDDFSGTRITPDNDGNVKLGKLVKTVNNIEADSNGNVDLGEIGGSVVSLDDTTSTLTIDETDHQLLGGLYMFGSYYNPYNTGNYQGYIKMPDLYVRVNGKDRTFDWDSKYGVNGRVVDINTDANTIFRSSLTITSDITLNDNYQNCYNIVDTSFKVNTGINIDTANITKDRIWRFYFDTTQSTQTAGIMLKIDGVDTGYKYINHTPEITIICHIYANYRYITVMQNGMSVYKNWD